MAEKIGAVKYKEISSLEGKGIADLLEEVVNIGYHHSTCIKASAKKINCIILWSFLNNFSKLKTIFILLINKKTGLLRVWETPPPSSHKSTRIDFKKNLHLVCKGQSSIELQSALNVAQWSGISVISAITGSIANSDDVA